MREIVKGATDQSVVIRIIDSTAGTPEEAVDYDTSGLALWYRREGATKTAITAAALASLDAAHSDGGIEHIDDGYYRLDLPDAAVASGVDGVMVGGTVTGMIVIGCYVPLVDAWATSSALSTVDTVVDAIKAKTDNLPSSPAATGDIPSAASVADAVWDEAASGHTGAGTFGEKNQKAVPSETVGDYKADVAALATSAALSTVDTVVDAIKAVTDALPDAGALTSLATAAALTTVDTVVDAILEDTGTTLPATLSTIAGYIDTEVAAIKAKTDNLPAAPAATGDIPSAASIADAVWDEALGDHLAAGSTGAGLNAAGSAGDPWATSLPGAYGAGTAGKILGDNLNAPVGTVDTVVDAIKAVTDALPDAGALTSLATAAALTTVDTVVDAILEDTGTTLPATLSTIAGYIDTEVAAIKAKTDNLPAAPAATGDIPSAASIADAVWDETLGDHLGAGSTGAGLNAAGAAGDPWATALPGAYGAGTAGKIVGDNLNAPVGTVDTVVDAIKAVTDALPDAGALTSLATAAALTTVDTVVDAILEDTGTTLPATLSTIAGYIDTEVAAIKAVTDLLPDGGALLALANLDAAVSSRSSHDAAAVKTAIEAAGGHLELIKAVTDALTAAAAAKLAASAGTIVIGHAAAGTLSVTQMTTDLTEATDDHYNGRMLVWTSGVLAGQATAISDYDGASKMLTFTGVTEAPTAGDGFVIV